jgi:hypothetical protein
MRRQIRKKRRHTASQEDGAGGATREDMGLDLSVFKGYKKLLSERE